MKTTTVVKCHNCEEDFDYDVEGGGDREGNNLCDTCYRNICVTCQICEEDFFEPESAEETFLHVAPDDTDKEAGIYKVLKYPFFRSCLVFGFESFYEEAIEKVGSPVKQRYRDEYKPSGYICQDCFNKHTSNQ